MLRDFFGPKPNNDNKTAFLNHPAIQFLWNNKSDDPQTLDGFIYSQQARDQVQNLPPKVQDYLRKSFTEFSDNIVMHDDFKKYVNFTDIQILP